MTEKFSRNFAMQENVKGILESVEQGETLCDDVEAVREFMYVGGRECACGGCDAAMTARTGC